MANNKEHNRGQTDKSNGKYKPGGSFLDFFGTNSQLRKVDRDRSQYDKGWNNK
ncbi:hypothetical protein IMCC3317_33410 [Kordia antarctica]|uniref:Uncharacterized protein n=1 Tax=Kordia antarctica TaxID=1218801 RepID=A0A7L4ZMK4_9FLAO|nr:hypothetical protein [Kordia antarctica]QHI37958.1 hypothetical protein IMCC3317_33410 [Kordia antarctica]